MRKSNTAKAAEPAADLRQRAARARDAAGRFIRRPAIAASEADPALEAVAEFRAAWDTLGHAIDAAGTAEVASEIVDAEGDAYERLKNVRPTTPAGFRALAEAWAVVLEGERGGEPGVTHADHAADALIRGAGVCVPPVPLMVAEDPALAAIEAHRSAFEEYEHLASVANDLPSADPGYRAAALAAEELGRREIATYQALFGAKPATLAGTASLAAYMCDAVRTAQIDDKPSDGERALRTITEALQRLGPAAERPTHPDATLFALGADFMAAWAVEDAPDSADAEYLACTGLAEQIVRLPADTIAGLGIKALLLARLDSEDSGPRRPITARGPLASHWNVLRQIQEGAAQLAAAHDFGISMSAAADPETGFPVTDPAPAVEGLVGLLDLASATVDELQAIQSMAEHVGAVAYAYAWSPRCDRRSKRGSFPDFNDAGKLMRWLGDALTDVESAVDREVASRRPGNRLDRETRLSMRAVTLIENGDPDTIKAFALELLDHATAEARGY